GEGRAGGGVIDMRRIFHIFKKDARHLWPHAVAFAALLATLACADVSVLRSVGEVSASPADAVLQRPLLRGLGIHDRPGQPAAGGVLSTGVLLLGGKAGGVFRRATLTPRAARAPAAPSMPSVLSQARARR